MHAGQCKSLMRPRVLILGESRRENRVSRVQSMRKVLVSNGIHTNKLMLGSRGVKTRWVQLTPGLEADLRIAADYRVARWS